MKKFIITLFAVFYLGVSSGATVHFHYCMGQLIEWGLSEDARDNAGNCSNCGMKKGASEDCCKDQKQELKVKDSRKAPVISFQAKIFALEPQIFSELQEVTFSTVKELLPLSNAPPRTEKTAVFIRNCNFRI